MWPHARRGRCERREPRRCKQRSAPRRSPCCSSRARCGRRRAGQEPAPVRTFRRRLRSRAPQGAVQASPCNWRPCRRSAGARIRGRRAARRRDASSGAGPPGPGGPSAAPASSGSSAWSGAAGPSGSSWSGAPRAAGSSAAGGERPWPGAPGAAAPGGPGAFAGAAPAAWDSGPPRPAAGAAPVASHCVRSPLRRQRLSRAGDLCAACTPAYTAACAWAHWPGRLVAWPMCRAGQHFGVCQRMRRPAPKQPLPARHEAGAPPRADSLLAGRRRPTPARSW